MQEWKSEDVWEWISSKPYAAQIDRSHFELVDGEQLLRLTEQKLTTVVKNEKIAKQLWIDIEEIKRIDKVRRDAFQKGEAQEKEFQRALEIVGPQEAEVLKSKIWFRPSLKREEAEVFFLFCSQKIKLFFFFQS